VQPKSVNQRRYLEAIEKHDMVFGIGPAGTGKTYLAVAQARIEEAVLGRERALSGLREALGLPPGTPITLSRRTLFDPNPPVDLKQALALAHDVGHAPFGHAGEKALDAIMRAHGFSFDHNLHALRMVEDFEQRYADFRGLNLTFEVREGIVKHSREYSLSDFPHLAEYRLDERPPLEAQLIDLSDEIAYNAADLDDGYEARILTLQQIRSGVPIFENYLRQAQAQYPKAAEKLQFNEALKRMLDSMVTDLIQNTESRVRRAAVGSLEEVRRYPETLAAFSPEIERQRKQAKEFLYESLYYSEALRSEKEMAERIITELFEYWVAHPESLPASYREQSHREPLPRVICDYIAAMTDNYILDQHAKIFQR